MTALLVIYLICLSGSAAGYMSGCRRSIRLVPVTIMGIIVFLYVCGLLRVLLPGVYAVSALCFLIYAAFLFYVIKNRRQQRQSLKEFFLSAVPFTLFYLIISFSTKGMLVHEWDEFSHWGTVVKAMFYIDDLATNPASDCMFASYPPAMALWQYYVQKINVILHPGNDFVEWRLYFAYQVFSFSLLIPVIADGKKRRFEAITLTLLLITAPVMFFTGMFQWLYIDSFIAVSGALIFSYVMIVDDKDTVYDLYILLSCFILVLSKDVGIVFASITASAYALDMIFRYRKEIKRCWRAVLPLAAVLLARWSWAHELTSRNVAAALSSRIDFPEYLHMLLYHDGSGYRQQTVDSTISAFFSRIESEVWAIPYFAIFLVFVILSIVCLVVLCRNKVMSPVRCIMTGAVPAVLVAGYAAFIGAMYAYRFSVDEALSHAGYSRYMFVVFVFHVLVIVMLADKAIMYPAGHPLILAVVCYGFLIIASRQAIPDYFFRYDVAQSEIFRSEYKDLCKRIKDFTQEDSTVYLLSREESSGSCGMVVDFERRPIPSDLTKGPYSLGPGLSDEDVSSRDLSPEEWILELQAEEVDYVAIHRLGSDFIENYGSVFEDPSAPDDDTVFYFDKEKRQLIKCSYE